MVRDESSSITFLNALRINDRKYLQDRFQWAHRACEVWSCLEKLLEEPLGARSCTEKEKISVSISHFTRTGRNLMGKIVFAYLQQRPCRLLQARWQGKVYLDLDI